MAYRSDAKWTFYNDAEGVTIFDPDGKLHLHTRGKTVDPVETLKEWCEGTGRSLKAIYFFGDRTNVWKFTMRKERKTPIA